MSAFFQPRSAKNAVLVELENKVMNHSIRSVSSLVDCGFLKAVPTDCLNCPSLRCDPRVNKNCSISQFIVWLPDQVAHLVDRDLRRSDLIEHCLIDALVSPVVRLA